MNKQTDNRSITMAEIMTPDMTNFSGNIHGGQLMRFFDKVAYACAVQYASLPMVTLCVDQLFFKKPLHIADLLICKARVNYVGKTSLEVGIHAEAKNLMTGELRDTNTCYFTMVALADGKPATIPPFEPIDEIDKRRYQEAIGRRHARVEYYSKHHC